jgi:hypothetical protein
VGVVIQWLPWLGVGLIYVLYQLFPTSFETLFLINIWLISVPHTFATFTRSDRRKIKSLILPIVILLTYMAAIVFTGHTQGIVLIYGIYFCWQQFHYTRQNYGIGKQSAKTSSSWDQAFYLISSGLILLSSFSSGPQNFFGYALANPLPLSLSANVCFFLVFSAATILSLFQKTLMPLEHVLIFSLAYLGAEHFALGWLLLNVYHNLQYLSFMQLFERKWSYLLWPLSLTLAFFILQHHSVQSLNFFSVPLGLALMLALNFTHYTFDGVIWRRSS